MDCAHLGAGQPAARVPGVPRRDLRGVPEGLRRRASHRIGDRLRRRPPPRAADPASPRREVDPARRHCEPSDDTLADAALREAREESGIAGLDLDRDAPDAGLVHLHTHPITCSLGVPTRHLDVRYRIVAAPTADGSLPRFARSEESVDLQWWPIDALPDNADADIPELIRAGLTAERTRLPLGAREVRAGPRPERPCPPSPRRRR